MGSLWPFYHVPLNRYSTWPSMYQICISTCLPDIKYLFLNTFNIWLNLAPIPNSDPVLMSHCRILVSGRWPSTNARSWLLSFIQGPVPIHHQSSKSLHPSHLSILSPLLSIATVLTQSSVVSPGLHRSSLRTGTPSLQAALPSLLWGHRFAVLTLEEKFVQPLTYWRLLSGSLVPSGCSGSSLVWCWVHQTRRPLGRGGSNALQACAEEPTSKSVDAGRIGNHKGPTSL